MNEFARDCSSATKATMIDDTLTLYMPDFKTVRMVECSPPSWMVHMVLEEKAVDYEVLLLSYTAGEHRSPEMLARNPRGTLPVLSHGRVNVFESFACLSYVEFAFPVPGLMPRSLGDRAVALTRLHESENLKIKGMALFRYLMQTRGLDLDFAKVEALVSELHDELLHWESYYDKTLWSAGETPTLADFSVFAYLATTVHLGLRLAQTYPALGEFYQRMRARPSVVETWPERWHTKQYTFLAEL